MSHSWFFSIIEYKRVFLSLLVFPQSRQIMFLFQFSHDNKFYRCLSLIM